MSLIAYRAPTNGAASNAFSGWDREFSRWLDHANTLANNLSEQRSWRPAADIVETSEGFDITLDLPGVNPESVDITVDDGVLTIAGERPQREQAEGSQAARIERGTGAFRRAFSLPDSADADNVTAAAEHGVLTVRIGKVATPEPRKISVQVNRTPVESDAPESVTSDAQNDDAS